jgi:hypothetical protein
MNLREYEPARDFLQSLMTFLPRRPLANWLLSAALAGLALLHAWPRRTSYTKLIFWLALVVLFGLVGLLTYLALNHTATITCQTCGKKRGLIEPDCPRCRSLLPSPPHAKHDLIFNT